MGELLRFPGHNPEAYVIVNTALNEVADLYGSGYPDYRPGRYRNLAYHNIVHTYEVTDAAIRLSEEIGLDERDKMIVRLAASHHDLIQRALGEHSSADILEGRMKNSGAFNSEELEITRLAIIGTIPEIEDGSMTSQRANVQQYPSKRAELIAKIVACADLAQLFAPIGPLRAHELYCEEQGITGSEEPPLAGLAAFEARYQRLLQSYEYPLEEVEGLFGGLRKEVYEHSLELFAYLNEGYGVAWQQILEADRKFLQKYSHQGI